MFGWQTTLPSLAVLSTVVGSFGLGNWGGKRLLVSRPPLDWFLDMAVVVSMLFSMSELRSKRLRILH